VVEALEGDCEVGPDLVVEQRPHVLDVHFLGERQDILDGQCAIIHVARNLGGEPILFKQHLAVALDPGNMGVGRLDLDQGRMAAALEHGDDLQVVAALDQPGHTDVLLEHRPCLRAVFLGDVLEDLEPGAGVAAGDAEQGCRLDAL